MRRLVGIAVTFATAHLLRNPFVRLGVVAIGILGFATTSYAQDTAGGTVTVQPMAGTDKAFGNYINPKGFWELQTTGKATAEYLKIDVKLEKWDGAKWIDFAPFMPATPGLQQSWSSPAYHFLPLGEYRVFARFQYKVTLPGMDPQLKEVTGSKEVTFK